jgi:hypothetical protein
MMKLSGILEFLDIAHSSFILLSARPRLENDIQ